MQSQLVNPLPPWPDSPTEPASWRLHPPPRETATPMPAQAPPLCPYATQGELISRRVRHTRDALIRLAELSYDQRQVCGDGWALQCAQPGKLIAPDHLTSAMMMGVLASHFARPPLKQLIAVRFVNFSFSYKSPLFAEQDIALRWKVNSLEFHRALQGWLLQVDGQASVAESNPAIAGLGSIVLLGAPQLGL